MSKSATREYTVMMRKRYAVMITKKAKGAVLKEFCETVGVGRLIRESEACCCR